MYVETGQGQPEPHEETEEEQIKREGADTIALDSGPVDTERWHRHPRAAERSDSFGSHPDGVHT